MERHTILQMNQIDGESNSDFEDGVSEGALSDLHQNEEVKISPKQELSQQDKPKKKKREVIVEVKEVEVDDDYDATEATPADSANAHKNDAQVEESAPPASSGLKIDLGSAKQFKNISPDRVQSPAINIIDSNLNKRLYVKENEASTDFIPILASAHLKEGVHHATPDKFKTNEEAKELLESNELPPIDPEHDHLSAQDPPAIHTDQNNDTEDIEDEVEKQETEGEDLAPESTQKEIEKSNEKTDEISHEEDKVNHAESDENRQSQPISETVSKQPSLTQVAPDNDPEPTSDLQCDEIIDEISDSEAPQKSPEQSEEEKQKILAKQEASEHARAKYDSIIEAAQQLKKEGNEHFKAGEYKQAKAKYVKAYAHTRTFNNSDPNSGDGMVDLAMKAKGVEGGTEEYTVIAKALERDINNNMAIIFLKEENYPKAIEKATKSLNIEKTVKAYFNRGKAYALKNDFESSYADFEQGKVDFPESAKVFSKEILKTKAMEKLYDKEASQKLSGFLNQS
jgi:tetratricopeptide (TPR) repeat protein